jgi:hypothetical protein
VRRKSKKRSVVKRAKIRRAKMVCVAMKRDHTINISWTEHYCTENADYFRALDKCLENHKYMVNTP